MISSYTVLSTFSTLKTLGVASAATAIPTGALFAGTLNQHGPTVNIDTANKLGTSDLKIEIFTAKTASYNTIVFTNLSEQPLPIKHFLTGSVIWNRDQYLDLNSLHASTGQHLEPGATRKVSTYRQTAKYALQSESLRVDDAITLKDKHNSHILLGAYAADGQLHAYPIPVIPQLA